VTKKLLFSLLILSLMVFTVGFNVESTTTSPMSDQRASEVYGGGLLGCIFTIVGIAGGAAGVGAFIVGTAGMGSMVLNGAVPLTGGAVSLLEGACKKK